MKESIYPASISLSGQFADHEIERQYQASQYESTRKRMRFVCILTGSAYLGGAYANYLQLPWGPFLIVASARLATALIGILPFLTHFPKAATPKSLGVIVFVYMSSIMATEILELCVGVPYATLRETPITIVIALMFYLLQTPQLWQPIIVSGLGSIAYIIVLIACVPMDIGYISNTALTFGLANGFGAYFYIRFGVSQRKMYLAGLELKRRAEYDPLTGILNRGRALELIERELKAAKRYDHPCSLLMMDVDDFKAINDSYGHVAGDEVLAKLVGIHAGLLRECDILGRFGGEEFIIALPHSNRAQAEIVAERLRAAACEAPIQTVQGPVSVSVSIGVAELAEAGQTIDELIRLADAALYAAKHEGRNMVCVSSQATG